MSSAKLEPLPPRRFWRSSSARLALLAALGLWLLNALLVVALYNFTVDALVRDIADDINHRIDQRLAAWPKQLPQAGVTAWLYRQLAVQVAELEDCVALVDSDGDLELANIDTEAGAEFSYRGFYTATYTGHRWRDGNERLPVTCLVTDRALTDGGRLSYGVPFDSYLATLRQLGKLRFWGLLITGLVALTAGIVFALRQLHGVHTIAQLCDRVAAGDLKQRLPLSGKNSDLDHIAAAVNHMLDQIEQLMTGVREVSDAIAHDLKTPLARLRGQLELLLSISERSDEAIDAVIAEADQVLSAFNALLRIAQLEQGTRRQAFVQFDFKVLAEQAREMYELVFADKDIAFTIDTDAQPLPVYGDRELWLQALSNLLDNAYKYTPAGGAVGLALRRDGAHVAVEIRDTGPGIPRGEHQNVFQRFYRLDKHRSQKGIGLGLSLVAAVCKLHQASIGLANERGLVVRIAVPLDTTAPAGAA